MTPDIDEFDRQARFAHDRQIDMARREAKVHRRWFMLLVAATVGLWLLVGLLAADLATGKVRWQHSTASWYGPGLFGNTMGCGGTLTPGTLGVAHKSMRCGTRLRVCYRRCKTVRVVDRGPYVHGRMFDLTQATKHAIGFPSVATVRWRTLR